jgi:hypothetical protein
MIHQNLLRYRGSRYLWIALALILASTGLYLSQDPGLPPNGGSWQGYVLGSVGALLILWLALLGVRKRSYSGRLGKLQGWASAHVYLGSALLVIATLHGAAQFGWNVHSLAYLLMCLVIASGGYGTYAYLVQPGRMAANRAGSDRESRFSELFELGNRCRDLGDVCDAEVGAVVASSIERTRLGGGAIVQLSARDGSKLVRRVATNGSSTASKVMPNPDQQAVVDFVAERIPRAEKRGEAASLQGLLAALSLRQAVVRQIRRDIQLDAWLKGWLWLHVPLTVGLLGALVVHIAATFLYR